MTCDRPDTRVLDVLAFLRGSNPRVCQINTSCRRCNATLHAICLDASCGDGLRQLAKP